MSARMWMPTATSIRKGHLSTRCRWKRSWEKRSASTCSIFRTWETLPLRTWKLRRKAGVKVDGHFGLLCTGFHKRNYPSIDSVWKNPLLTVEATRWLFDRKSKMHGVEGPSTDKPTDNIFAQHRLCRDLGISHWEWLVNLEELLGKGEFQFFGVPLKFKGGSGSPVRAFAIVG